MTDVVEVLKAGARRVVDDVRSSTTIAADLVEVRQEDDDFVVEVEIDGTRVSWTLPHSDEDEAAVFVADGVQYEVELRSQQPWPQCEGLPRHSLRPVLVGESGAWVCDEDHVKVAIGHLGSAGTR